MKFLEKVKQKSQSEKEAFAFKASFLITFCIFSIWLFTLIYGFTTPKEQNDQNLASPVNIFNNQIKSFFSGKEVYNAEK